MSLYGIEADQGQIEQVLLNLYVNAADAMTRGGDLFLKTTNVTEHDMKGEFHEPEQGDYVLVTVQDTGAGMDQKTMDRIFDPFFTAKGLPKARVLDCLPPTVLSRIMAGTLRSILKRGEARPFVSICRQQKKKS